MYARIDLFFSEFYIYVMNKVILISHFLIGPLLTLIAIIVKYNPPKKINHLYGYRTSRSMKSQEVWDVANAYSTDLMIWVGIITTISQIILYLITSPLNALLIPCLIMIILLIGMIVRTENYLKANFDSEGKRKSR